MQTPSIPTRRRAALGLACLVAVGMLHAAPPATADGIEAAALMQALLLPQGSTRPPDWHALDALPIRWKTASAVAAPARDRKLGLPQVREGSFVLQVAGRPGFESAPGRAGHWDIQLLGSAEGVSEVRWSPSELGRDLDDGIHTLQTVGIAMRQVCTTPSVSSNTTVWRVARPGALVATLRRESSAGSMGTMIDFTLPYTRSRVAAARCD